MELTAPDDVQLPLLSLPGSSASREAIADQFMVASSEGRVQAVRLLLAAGVKIDLIAQKKTALMCASEYCQAEVVQLLVEARANVDQTTVGPPGRQLSWWHPGPLPGRATAFERPG